MVTGQRKYTLDNNSPLSNAHVVSVRTRRYSASARTKQGLTLANDATFDAAGLVLKKDTQTIVFDCPLAHIEKATLSSPESGYPVFAQGLNFSACEIEVAPGVTVDAGKAIELTFEYFEKK